MQILQCWNISEIQVNFVKLFIQKERRVGKKVKKQSGMFQSYTYIMIFQYKNYFSLMLLKALNLLRNGCN